jgi:hypothetical protein
LRDEVNADAIFKDLEARYQPQDMEIKKITPTIEDCFIDLMKESGQTTNKAVSA